MDLSTHYIGLKLKTPIIVGSCDLTSSLETIGEIARKGAGAIVLSSIYEEEIALQRSTGRSIAMYGDTRETQTCFTKYSRFRSLEQYLDLIEKVKTNVDIPVIANINCVSASDWITFAKDIQKAGADAIELTVYLLPVDIRYNSEEVEKTFYEIITKIKTHVTLPVTLKIGAYFSGAASMISKLSKTDISGLVLFNRFVYTDINLDNFTSHTPFVLSNPNEYFFPLHWIITLAERVECDLVASSGIHTSEAVIKCLLAGAKAVEVVSVLYSNGVGYIEDMLREMEVWLTKNKFNSLQEIIGKMAHPKIEKPIMAERRRFIQYHNK